MAGPQRFDAIVVGGGHNGLITAAQLARAGKSVCLVERRASFGGRHASDACWPGYRASLLGERVHNVAPDLAAELRLGQYGWNVRPVESLTWTPLIDGRSLLLTGDARRSSAEISRFSGRDAATWPKFRQLCQRLNQALDTAMRNVAPDPWPLPKERRRIGMAKRLRDTGRLWDLYQAAGALGEDLAPALDFAVGSARRVLESWFEAEVVRATIALDAALGSLESLWSAGSALRLIQPQLGGLAPSVGASGFAAGGAGTLIAALAAACSDLRVDLRRESEVKRLLVADGKTRGVALTDGRLIEAPIVASSLDAPATFLRLLEPGELPESFRAAVSRLDHSAGTAIVQLGLGEAPRFLAAAEGLLGSLYQSRIRLVAKLDDLERAYDDAKYGWPSRDPVVELTLPTAHDPSLAPEGKHLLSALVHYAPYQLAEGRHWDDTREALLDHCVAKIARFAPNVATSVEHRRLLTPADLEREYGLTGGNLLHGAATPGQSYALRPVAGWADHRTPIQGLYLCGAAVHPGSAVWGQCGLNAATEILRDG